MNRCLPTPVIVARLGAGPELRGNRSGIAHEQLAILRAVGADRLGLEVDRQTGEPFRVGDQVAVEFRVPVEFELFAEVLAVGGDGYQALLEVTGVVPVYSRYANGFSRPEEQQA